MNMRPGSILAGAQIRNKRGPFPLMRKKKEMI
jgi:hypothetical protein